MLGVQLGNISVSGSQNAMLVDATLATEHFWEERSINASV